ncbi:MAG: endo-1,4-beta-xylanase, partial [Duncaniella sp.]|nr:endo-1,4-beta-xylanase [Duncaniella sp.]
MHVSSSISKEQVDAMFKTLAATGKLIRITELDITVGTKTPSADQLQKQADCYHMILTSYFENIPENQQSAITLWTLSDNEKEHEYWLKDDAPNVFDASYGRKLAYKSVCDAIAGKDVSADFRSHDYSKK